MNLERYLKYVVIVVIFSFLLLSFATIFAKSVRSQKADTLEKDLREIVQKEFEKAKKDMQEYTETNIRNTESWISFAKTVTTILGVLIALVFGFQIVKSIQMDKEYDRIIEIRKEAQKILEKTAGDLDSIKQLLSSLVQSSVKEYADVIKDQVKVEISKDLIKPAEEQTVKRGEIEDKLKNIEAQVKLLAKLNANVSPVVYSSKGLISLRQGDISEAIRSFQTALEIDPRDKSTILNLAEAYILNKQYDTSIEFITEKSRHLPHIADQIILKQLQIEARCLGGQDYSKDLTFLLDFFRERKGFSLVGLWDFKEIERFLTENDIDRKKKDFISRLIRLLTGKISVEEYESELELGV